MRRQFLAFAGCALVVASSAALAQGSKGKPRTQAKPPTKPATRPAVKGTTQLAGDNAKVGQTYTLGKGSDCYNLTFTKIEYNADRVVTEAGTMAPGADEKLLVMHYTVHNPNSEARSLHARIFRFTAYDADNVTYSFHGDENMCKDPTGDPTASMLQPAQKVAVMTWMRVPAKVAITKIMTEIIDVTPVLRLMLTPKDITPLAAPFADPSSPDGSVALAEVKADAGSIVHLGPLDATIVGVAYANTDPAGSEPTDPETHQYAVVTIRIKNAGRETTSASWEARVRTAGGDKVNCETVFKLNIGETAANPKLDPGEEAGYRMSFRIAKADTVTSVTLWYEEGSRMITVPIK